MLSIDSKHAPLLLEAIEELLYKVALRLEALKGGPMTGERKALTAKQRQLERLQHELLRGDTSGTS